MSTKKVLNVIEIVVSFLSMALTFFKGVVKDKDKDETDKPGINE